MSINDRLMKLLTGGLSTIGIGLSPDGKPFVQATQGITTGDAGNGAKINHQRVGATIEEALEGLTRDVEHIAKLNVEPSPRSNNIIQVPGAN